MGGAVGRIGLVDPAGKGIEAGECQHDYPPDQEMQGVFGQVARIDENQDNSGQKARASQQRGQGPGPPVVPDRIQGRRGVVLPRLPDGESQPALAEEKPEDQQVEGPVSQGQVWNQLPSPQGQCFLEHHPLLSGRDGEPTPALELREPKTCPL